MEARRGCNNPEPAIDMCRQRRRIPRAARTTERPGPQASQCSGSSLPVDMTHEYGLLRRAHVANNDGVSFSRPHAKRQRGQTPSEAFAKGVRTVEPTDHRYERTSEAFGTAGFRLRQSDRCDGSHAVCGWFAGGPTRTLPL
eukprot:1194810-Prorocentrum_minimum.AAC.9